MTAGPPDHQQRLEELVEVYAAAEELAERLDAMKLYKAAAYVSMGLDVIRDVRSKFSAPD